MSSAAPLPRKLMFALWGSDLVVRLADAGLHRRLADLGLDRLQVNADDVLVGERAMRISTFDEPIAALVSVWAPAEPTDAAEATADAVATALATVADRVEGWAVEERRPLEPPEAWDGSRAEALANVALLRRPPELPREEWLHRWLVDHTPVAIRTQETFGYVQNIVIAPITRGAPHVDALVEELFPPEAAGDLHAFYGSGGDDAELKRRLDEMLASCERFGANRGLDVVASGRYLHPLR